MARQQRACTRSQRLVRRVPVTAVASLTTLGAMSFLATGTAAAADSTTTGNTSAKPAPTPEQISAYLAAHPAQAKWLRPFTTTSAKAGVGQTITPQFGVGKPTIRVIGKPGTFPASPAPSFSGLVIDVLAPPAITSPASVCTVSGSPATCSTFLPTGIPLTVTLHDPSALPAGFLNLAPLIQTVPECGSPPFCPGTLTVEVPGTWRPIGVKVTNSKTSNPVANATYHLFQGATDVATATSNSGGVVTFPGLYQGGNFSVRATGVPSGYQADTSHGFTMPVVTDAAQSGVLFQKNVKLKPKPPVLVDDAVAMDANTTKNIAVLANDTAVSAPLTLTSLGTPAHGTVTKNANGSVTYAPDAGFDGTDTFTYTATNVLGGVATATVTVTVNAVAAANGSALPFTGAGEVDRMVQAGVGLLGAGIILMAGGAVPGLRRRLGLARLGVVLMTATSQPGKHRLRD
ncbi:MAG: hypothetical protein QOG53_287 [Frankiales bacterium]|jgi:hypothetical protein|nr:hypothetical protein [Frankiales bacterium]